MTTTAPHKPLSLAILPDFAEENWPSMDLVAEMLWARLADWPAEVSAVTTRPAFQTRFGWAGSRGRNADRLWNRLATYPRFMRRIAHQHDYFHICDHSYAQLVHALPADRTGVFCHDLDTFRCLIEPARDPRPRWFRAIASRALRGMQKAAVVFHTTDSVRRELLHHDLIDEAKLVNAPCGVAPEFTCLNANRTVPAEVTGDFVLHVGSCIARKRLDVLLAAIAARPGVRLLQVGGTWTAAHREQIARLSLADRVIQLPRQNRAQLADLYRRAMAVVIPSDAEGFGLPVIEALACGAVVVASDIPALREVGGDAVIYCAPGDVEALVVAIDQALSHDASIPNRDLRLRQAARFSWKRHARVILDAYLSLKRGRVT